MKDFNCQKPQFLSFQSFFLIGTTTNITFSTIDFQSITLLTSVEAVPFS